MWIFIITFCYFLIGLILHFIFLKMEYDSSKSKTFEDFRHTYKYQDDIGPISIVIIFLWIVLFPMLLINYIYEAIVKKLFKDKK